MKILTVVGARPNFMKAAPIIAAIEAQNRNLLQDKKNSEIGIRLRHVLVHTGQHYDEVMSGKFFGELNLPEPDIHMGVGSCSHAVQTAEIMKKFEEIILKERPDVVVVVGDVNSTLACALVASKISFDDTGTRPLIAHVEAGLRSFDRSMPEEINRIVTDHISDLLFVTEGSGLTNLKKEGVSSEKVHFVGNTMIDSLLAFKEKADSSTKLEELGLRSRVGQNGVGEQVARYALLTLHRPANVDNRESLRNILDGLEELGQDCPIVFPVHPRTQNRIKEFGIDFDGRSTIKLIDPLGYLDFLCLMKNASIVVTDSGGVQEETTYLGIPCITVRENTERPVTVQKGTNIIAGTRREGIQEAIRIQLNRSAKGDIPQHWDGKAAARILAAMYQVWNAKKNAVAPPVLAERNN